MDGPSSTWPAAGSEPSRPEPNVSDDHHRPVTPGRGGPRRWPWAVAVLLLLVVAGSASAIAWDQRETAAQWQERAEVLEDRRDEALGRGEALQAQLDDLADLLAASEMDVADLEQRIRALADEKAQAQDTATTVQVERDVLADVSTQVAAAVEALDACVTRLFDLQESSVEAFNRAAANEPVDVGPLNAQSEATTSFCNEARSAAASAAGAAERIPG